MFGLPTQTEIINNIIKDGATSAMDDIRFIEEEIKRWKSSKDHIEQINGERYYGWDHDIFTISVQPLARMENWRI